MRHCKSDWTAGSSSDHDRPLNARGMADAPKLGAWLRQMDHLPDTLLCSSAARCVQTAQGLDLPQATQTNTTRSLYLAAPEDMAALLHKALGDTVLMLGHNPGSAAFATDLTADWPAHPDFPRFPTGAALVLHFDITNWSAATPGTGHIAAFTTPRDLA